MKNKKLQVVAQSTIPTEFGMFDMHIFHYNASDNAIPLDHIALTVGDLNEENVLVRVHSECITSEVFGSLKCDCKRQLIAAQKEISDAGRGIIIYLRQEGRGIGLVNKIRAYDLQNAGYDTVDANRMLGLPDDSRDYESAAAVINHFGIKSVQLLTNNPLKVESLKQLGVKVNRKPLICEIDSLSENYLETKRIRMGHILPELRKL